MGPPFDTHPTSASEIRTMAQELSRSQGQLDAVATALEGPAQAAADNVDGTLDGVIRGPIDPNRQAAMDASAGARLCRGAVDLFADCVERFDRGVEDINQRWERAKQHEFYVLDDAADRDQAIADARSEEAEALRAEYRQLEQALDIGARMVATALNAGPAAGSTMLATFQEQVTHELQQLDRPEYVSLGDSYSAGTGTGTYYTSGPNNPFRSRDAYAWQLAREYGLRLDHQATNGATTQSIDQNQLSSLGEDTEYVTITAGGNNIGFADTISAAATSLGTATPEINESRRQIREELPGELDSLYTEIRERAPNATVVVGTYPRLFDGEAPRLRRNLVGVIDGNEEEQLNAAADELGNTIEQQAEEHGFEVADVRDPFTGHGTETGDDDRWINGIVLRNGDGEVAGGYVDADSFHPNIAGHQGYADVFDEHFAR